MAKKVKKGCGECGRPLIHAYVNDQGTWGRCSDPSSHGNQDAFYLMEVTATDKDWQEELAEVVDIGVAVTNIPDGPLRNIFGVCMRCGAKKNELHRKDCNE